MFAGPSIPAKKSNKLKELDSDPFGLGGAAASGASNSNAMMFNGGPDTMSD